MLFAVDRIHWSAAGVFRLLPGLEPSLFPSRVRQTWQPGKGVGGHRQKEAGSRPLDPAIDGLGHANDGFFPAESLFDPFAVLEGQSVTFVPGGAAVDGGLSRFPTDMRRDAGLPEAGDKFGGVIPVV